MKIVEILNEGVGRSYYEVTGDLPVWIGVSSGRGFPTFIPKTLRAGDQLHWLPGGMFAVQGDKVIRSIHLDNPDKHTEGEYHAYRNGPDRFVDRQLSKLVQSGAIEEIPETAKRKVNYNQDR